MRRYGLLLVVVACVGFPCAAEESSPSDFASPKTTMKTLLTILRDGETDRIASCFVEPRNDDERNMLLYGLSDAIYTPAVHRALVAQFGEQASPLGKVLASFDEQLAVVDSMVEKTEAGHGRLWLKGYEQGALTFIQVEEQWKIALTPGLMLRAVPPKQLAAAKAVRAAYLTTIAEIKEGKFATAEQATKTLEARRRASVPATASR